MAELDASTQAMIRNLEETTGRTLDAWTDVVRGMGDLKHGQVVKALKSEHGLTHGYANLVAHAARGAVGPDAPSAEDLVEAQYAGVKAGLRPIYDALAAAVASFGSDVELAPKKTYVSLRRSKQFGLVQPSTRTRVDVGLNLEGLAPSGRLEASGSFSSMVTHRVRLSAPAEVDDEVIAWLRRAYEQA